MQMHLLSGGRLSIHRKTYYPDARPDEWFNFPVHCALFKHAQGIALFDTGCHPGAADDPASRWGERKASYLKPDYRPEDTVIHQLVHAGVSVDDVDLVICSHFHVDHCGCNEFFKRATVICQASELEAAKRDDADQMWGFVRSEWDVGLPMTTIDGVHDVFGDGRLTLLPLPGHTPGSMGAHAVLDKSGPFLLPVDAAPVAYTLAQRSPPERTWDPALYLASLEEIARHADEGATVLFAHDADQWDTLKTGAYCYQ